MTLAFTDSNASPQNLKSAIDGNGEHTPYHNANLIVAGVDVGNSNPVPVAYTINSAAIGNTNPMPIFEPAGVPPTGVTMPTGGVGLTGWLGAIWSAITGIISTKEVKSSTGTYAAVGSANSNTTILASNANRLGAAVFNDSTATLYLRLTSSGTATTNNYTVQLAPNQYYEVPFGYTGQILGIWSAVNGNARVTEFTA